MGRLLNKTPLILLVLAMIVGVFGIVGTQAQDNDEKSSLLKYVEEKISTDNFRISLNGIEGVLSSDVQLESITISDAKGIWLTVINPRMVWSRTALLTGTLSIDSLTAQSIDYKRNPVADETLPDPEATPFALPELPVSIVLKELQIESVNFGEAVFGLEAQASVQGMIELADGELDLDLEIKRQDGPGGELKALANYNADNQNLKLDVKLSEPQNGIIANALKLEGRPPVAFAVEGDAPISELEVKLGFDVTEKRILTGQLNLDGSDNGTLANAQLSGPLSTILAQEYREFFGSTTNLSAEALFGKSGAVNLRNLSFNSGEARLNAKANRMADGFLSAFELQFSLNPSTSERVNLPLSQSDTSLSAMDLSINYDAAKNDSWDAKLLAKDIQRDGVEIEQADITASGVISDFNTPSNRSVSFEVFGNLDGYNANDEGINEAVGRAIKLYSTGKWQEDKPTEISAFRISGETFNLTTSGQFENYTYDGSSSIEADNIAAFSSLAGRNLNGKVNMRVDGRYQINSGGFDFTLDGTTRDFTIDHQFADPLLAGTTKLSGGIARNENGLAFETLRLTNNQFESNINGRLASEVADVTGNALIRNLSTVSKEAEGKVELTLNVNGQQKPFALRSEISLSKGKLQNREVEDLAFNFSGTVNDSTIRGKFGGNGTLDGKPVSLDADLDTSNQKLSLQSLEATITDTNITGNFLQDQQGIMEGTLDIDSSDIGDVAALGLIDASGGLDGKLELINMDGLQTLKTNLSLQDIRYQTYRVGSGNLVATVVDLFNKPQIGATLGGENIIASGTTITSLNAEIGTVGEATDFTILAELSQNNARLEASGSLLQEAKTNTITLKNLALNSNIADANLQSPARLVTGNGGTRISNAVLQVGSGSLRVNGSAGDQLNLDIDVNALPVSIINAIRPETQAGGSLSGDIKVSGTASKPIASFNLSGNDMTAAPLREAGISPLKISTSGQYGNNSVRLDALQMNNNQSISIAASGSIPLVGNGLNVQAKGVAPLAFVSSSLAERGASVSGNANFDMRITGNLDKPNANGVIDIANASFTDPQSNLKLVGINLRAALTGDRIRINNGQASLASGGNIRIGGDISLSDNLPANVTITLADASYSDGQTFSTRASGDLAIQGALLSNPTLTGIINLTKTEITVPENFSGDAELLEVTHVQPDAQTRETLARREQANPTSDTTSAPSVLGLDLTINAPNQIFVRGRGLDAEMGGNIRVRGPVNNIQPIGRFELRRGRLSILGQRIDLTEGEISLTGDLDPIIDMTAQTQAGDVDAFIRITGRVSNVEVNFTSSPELPQDEVLALIIFGRGLTDLSPSQIARLASIAAELTGGNSPGLVDGLRRGTGLDDLDVVEDEDGNAAVKAGKYVGDNVYLGVQAGQKNTEATINLDITDNVTARGAVSSDGNTSLGIFLEKDY